MDLFTRDSDDDPTDIEARPGDRSEATIHNQPSSDMVGRAIDHLDGTRMATGVVDGYEIKVRRTIDIVDGQVVASVRVDAADGHATFDDPWAPYGRQGERTTDDLFAADAVFEKLVRRYELTEHEFGMHASDGEGGAA